MIWAEKLSKRNTSARGMLSTARRIARDDDSFLKVLDIGDPDSRRHKEGFSGADDIARWFRNDKRQMIGDNVTKFKRYIKDYIRYRWFFGYNDDISSLINVVEAWNEIS